MLDEDAVEALVVAGGFLIGLPFAALLMLLYRRLVAAGVIPRTPPRPACRVPPGR